MAITAPVLAGVTLPHTSEYTFRQGFRGAGTVFVNGGMKVDLVALGAKRVFILTWRGVTTTQMNTINTRFNAVRDVATPFSPPTDTGSPETVNVTWVENQLELEWTATSASGGQRILWETVMQLREV